MPRKPIGAGPMTPAQRQARKRAAVVAEIERLRDALRDVLEAKTLLGAKQAARTVESGRLATTNEIGHA